MSHSKDMFMSKEEEYLELYGTPLPPEPTEEDYKMSEPIKVEDLVKAAIKDAMEKRKVAESTTVTAAASPTPVSEESIMPTLSLAEGEVWASKLVGKIEYDFPVKMFKDTDWDESIRSFIPKYKDDYHLVKNQATDILRAWALNEKVLIHGPTGAGKSSIVEQLCALTNRPFIRINCTGDMDSSMVFGQLTAKDGSTVWIDGPVTEAVRHGAVFAWDEWDVTPPEIAMGLQWLLEDEGKLYLKECPGASLDKFITPHDEFRLVAIGNTQGQGDESGNHAGTNVQNSATLDRFGTCIHVNYLSESVETKMLCKKFGSNITEAATTAMVKVANLIRQGYTSGQLSLTMSPRALFSMCNKMSHGCSMADALKVVYLNKLNTTQRKVATELFRKVTGA